MKQKNYTLIFILGLFLTGNSSAQWISEIAPTENNLNSIFMLSEHIAWIVGDSGTILFKNEDVWIKYPKITDEDLCSVYMTDRNNGWAVGSKGVILHFTGGKWEVCSSPVNKNLFSVSFRDPEHGVAVGRNGTIAFFEKGTWTIAEKTTRGNLYTVSAKSDCTLIGGGMECVSVPVMNIINNKEKNLEDVFNPGFVEIRSLVFVGPENVWAVGSPGAIFHFDGNEWMRLLQNDKLSSLNSIFFLDKDHGISVGHSGTILTYSGNEWAKEASPVIIKLNGASISGNTYYAVGNKGTIISLRRVPEIAKGEDKNSTSVKIETYPNPSTDFLNIIIPDEGRFYDGLLTITNIFGRIISIESLHSVTGGQPYHINTSDLSNGLYIVQIVTTDNFKASGKFIVKR